MAAGVEESVIKSDGESVEPSLGELIKTLSEIKISDLSNDGALVFALFVEGLDSKYHLPYDAKYGVTIPTTLAKYSPDVIDKHMRGVAWGFVLLNARYEFTNFLSTKGVVDSSKKYFFEIDDKGSIWVRMFDNPHPQFTGDIYDPFPRFRCTFDDNDLRELVGEGEDSILHMCVSTARRYYVQKLLELFNTKMQTESG